MDGTALRPEIRKLKKAYLASGLTVAEWAKLAQVTKKQIYEIMRGEAVPRTSTFEKLALPVGLRLDVRKTA
jgi:predicted transcriptional regulator